MKRKYQIQGKYDGACFLYSIVNSIIALTSKKPTLKQWSNTLKYLPFANDFLNGKVGTQNYDNNPDVYTFAVRQALSELSPKENYIVTAFPKENKLHGIKKLLSEDSVVILSFKEHWISVVDVNVNRQEMFSACSEAPNDFNNYFEKLCGYKKKYNKIYKINERNEIYKSSVIQVKRSA